MPPVVANLIVGPATLKVGTYGQAEGSALDVGALEGGVTIENAREYYERKADPWLGVVGIDKIGEKMILKCALAEPTLDNLAIALGYPPGAVVGQQFKFGGDTTVTERTLYINGPGPGGGTRKYTIHKAVQVGTGSHMYKKGEKTLVELEFHVLQDTSKTANQQFGTFDDSGADTTPPTVALTAPVAGGTVTKDAKGTVVWTIVEAGSPLDENTIVYGKTFVITNVTTPGSEVLVAGSIVYDPVAKTVTFTPTNNWTASDALVAMVTTGLRDMAGNYLAAPKIEDFSVTA